MAAKKTKGIRMTEEEWDCLRAIADREGTTVSSIVRETLAEKFKEFQSVRPRACRLCGREHPWTNDYWVKYGNGYICTACARKLDGMATGQT